MKARSPEAARLEADYLSRLENSLENLEPAEASEIIQDVKQHIEDALGESPHAEVSLVEMAGVIEGLGPPESIAQGALGDVDAANPDASTPPGTGNQPRKPFPWRRLWIATIVLLLLGNVWLIRHLLILIERERVPQGEIVVVAHSPTDEANPETVSAIEFEFGSAVDPTTVDNNSIRLTPHVLGVVKLENERFLKLELSEPLSYATRYQIDFSNSLRGMRREKAPSVQFHFSTPGPDLKLVHQSKIEGTDVYLTFEFTLPVAPEELGRNLELTYPGGEHAEFEPVGAEASKEVTVLIPNVKFGKIVARIKPGLTSTVGSIPLDEKLAKVRSLEIKPAVSFVSMNPVYINGRPAIAAYFTASIDVSSARSRVKVEPEVETTIEGRSGGIRILGDFVPARRYSVTFQKGLSASDAGVLTEDTTRVVVFPDKNPELAFAFGGGYLSPDSVVKVPVRSVNVADAKLKIWRLYESNVIEYGLRGGAALRGMPDGVATVLTEEEIEFEGPRNADVETLIDLRKYAEGDIRGIYGLEIRSTKNYWKNDYAIAVVTDLGISVRLADDKALVWVTSIKTAKPVADVGILISSSTRQKLGTGRTGPDGVAIIDISDAAEGEWPALVVASTDDDLSYLNLAGTLRQRGEAAWRGRPYLTKGYEVMAFADRGAYRPQDEVRLSAFVRGTNWSTPEPIPLELTITKPNGRDLLKQTIMSDQAGRLLADFSIPYDAMTGQYNARYSIPGSKESLGSTSFVVAEYIPRTLRMKVTAPEDPLYVTKPIDVKVNVEHLFGDPARGLDVKCRAAFNSSNIGFDQPEWEAYHFGDIRVSHASNRLELPKQKLDDSGEAVFTIHVPSMTIPVALLANIEVEVIEPGGRALTERVDRTIHKWPFYVGVKRPDTLNAGEVGTFDVATVKPDGTLDETPERYKTKLFKVTSSYVLRKSSDSRFRYEWVTDKNLVATAEGDLDAGRGRAEITPEHPGRYEMVVHAGNGCPSTIAFYVSGAGARWESEEPDMLSLALDKKKYATGDTAKLEIKSPFDGAALITLEKDEVLKYAMVAVKGGRAEYEFPVADDWRPNIYVTATVIRPVSAEKEWMPHRASGVVRLDIDCKDRELDVRITSPESARPSRRFNIEAQITSDGHPQSGAAVLLIAVDEGVLALTNYKTPSPFGFFYAMRRLDVREYDMYSHLAPVLAAWLAKDEEKPGGDALGAAEEAAGRRLSTIRARRVKTAALYQGALVADDNGIARAEFDMPEYVGELRVMAFAADDEAFGTADEALPVKSPLMARASWPRFLAPGDSFKLPITVFNRTGAGGEVSLAVKTDGPIQPLDGQPTSAVVADGEEKTVHITMKATGVGKADARVVATLGDESYTESVEIPVRPAATFAKKGISFKVAAGTESAVEMPGGFVDGTQKVSLTITASPVVELAGALNYLLRYPYGCAEQTTSGLAPLIYLRDLAETTMPGAVGEQDIDRLLQAGFTRLWRMQTNSGGLSYWPGNKNPVPWASIYAADILLEARRAGHDVPPGLLDPLLRYLEKQVGSWAKSKEDLGYAAYACYVLARAGRPPTTWIATVEERIRDLRKTKGYVPATAVMHLAAAYLVLGETDAAKALALSVEPSATVRMTGGYLDSPVRELAINLLIMLDVEPDSDRIPRLAGRLKNKMKLGRWGTTQENAFALMALGKLARRSGGAQSGTVTLTLPDGTIKKADIKEGISIDDVEQAKTVKVRFEGLGTAFGFVNAEGVPMDGQVKEEDSGITIRRSFLNPKDNTVVGAGTLQQGELYVVRLQVNAKDRLDNVVILDMLPAGLEIENPQLQGSATVGTTVTGQKSRRIGAEFIDRRDDRIIVFCAAYPGENIFDYVVRAVTPGEYTLPAVNVSCMYDPDIFSVNGRGTIAVTP